MCDGGSQGLWAKGRPSIRDGRGGGVFGSSAGTCCHLHLWVMRGHCKWLSSASNGLWASSGCILSAVAPSL